MCLEYSELGRALINAGIGRMSALGANRTRRDGRNDVNDPISDMNTSLVDVALSDVGGHTISRSVSSSGAVSLKVRILV
jgi:hypothetical protein